MTAHLMPPLNEAGAASSAANLDSVFQQMERLVTTALEVTDFYEAFLKASAEATGARGAVIWIAGPDQTLSVSAEYVRESTSRVSDQVYHEARLRAVERVWARQQGERFEVADDSELVTEMLAPVVAERRCFAVVELIFGQSNGDVEDGRRHMVLQALADIAGGFHLREQRMRLHRELDWKAALVDYCQAIHGQLRVALVAQIIVNHGRRVIDCDRISLFLRRKGSLQATAISGVEAVRRRAGVIRSSELLVEAVAATGEPLWYEGDASGFAPQWRTPLETQLDHSQARFLAAVPLSADDDEVLGVLLLESFERRRALEQQRVWEVAAHTATAVQNAMLHEAIPFSRFASQLLRFSRRQMLKSGLAVAFAVIVLGALLAIPVDHRVACSGELRPAQRRDVFSTMDGVVDEILVAHGDVVKEGQLLASLHSPQLNLDLKRLWGEIQTVREQLHAAEVTQMENQPLRTDSRGQYHRLTAQKRELALRLEALEQQREILQLQQAELQIVSPIQGRIITWNVKQQLTGRPVQPGDRLMTVVNESGPWEVELHVAENRLTHVMNARRDTDGLPVSFVLDASPFEKHSGRLRTMALSAETDEAHGATVSFTMTPEGAIHDRRTGATVSARIHCGRRSLAFVWLHDLIEAIHVTLFY